MVCGVEKVAHEPPLDRTKRKTGENEKEIREREDEDVLHVVKKVSEAVDVSLPHVMTGI